MEKIDFVVLWVDGSDEEWQKEKEKYKNQKNIDLNKNATSNNRFRDWDNLHYWFRAVERYAGWVNNIFLVTYGHLPKWLNLSNPKLRIINHSDFIPAEYLPTFNSNTILLNLWRIKDLSEHFVVFNDDMFLTNKVSPSDFFKKGLPCDSFCFNIIDPIGTNDVFFHMILNNIDIINKHFNKKEVIKNNLNKIFTLKNGVENIRNFLLLPWSNITGFKDTHTANSYLKSCFKYVCEMEQENVKVTSSNKFRTNNDITEWIVRYWQLCSSKFSPRKINFSRYCDISNNNINEVCNYISKQKQKVICLNDSDMNIDFDKCKSLINKAFDSIYPEKSSFEKEKNYEN